MSQLQEALKTFFQESFSFYFYVRNSKVQGKRPAGYFSTTIVTYMFKMREIKTFSGFSEG